MSDITAREYRVAVKVAKECCDQSTVEHLQRLATKAETEFACPAYPHGEHECNTIPAETGPWQRIEDVPETVGRLTDRDGDVWEWDGDNWVTPETAILPTAYISKHFGPFSLPMDGAS